MRLNYFYQKIRHARNAGSLRDKSKRFLITAFRRPIVVFIGYLCLTKQDRKLNTRDGFSDHRLNLNNQGRNNEHLKRIIDAYKASKYAQTRSEKEFEIQGLWAEWITVNYQSLIEVLKNEDIPRLSSMMANLFREPCTIGTGGYDNYIRYRSALGNLYIKTVWSKYRDHLLTLGVDPEQLDFPNVGNQTGVALNGKIISIETLRHAYHAEEMRELLRNTREAVVVEIGGGLGGQAYQAVNMSNQISKYLVFDIPEVAVLSSYFLLSAFPEKKIRLFGEGPVSVTSSEDYDLAVFPHFSVSHLSRSSVDLFYNSCSFSEMDGASSRGYLSIVEKCCKKYFMHDNHDTVLQFKNPNGSVSTNVIGSDLTPDPTRFKRIYKKPRVHGLPEDWSFKQYEYLYEKVEKSL